MILSIQSHVAYGYVGNRAAVFPLQRMGYDVSAIHTVQFSNHTGYGAWTGDIFSPAHIRDIVNGLRDRGVLSRVDAVLSGYLGDPAIGQVVIDTVDEIRQQNPHVIYCCDPVMGDMAPRGFFVKESIPPFFRDTALKSASILTPNQFELNYLAGVEIKTLNDAIHACQKIIKDNVEIVLLTSLHHSETPDSFIQMLAVHRNGDHYIITTPKYNLNANGSGDCTAALFLGHWMKTKNIKSALELTATGIHKVFEKTFERQQRELVLIESQNYFAITESEFTAQKI